MSKDWRTRLQRDPRVIALDLARKRRHRELCEDPMYVLESDSLKRQLEKAYEWDPKAVTDFFRQFSWAIAPKLKAVNGFLQEQQSASLRQTLRQYVKHSNRFRVTFKFQKKPPHFRTVEDHAVLENEI